MNPSYFLPSSPSSPFPPSAHDGERKTMIPFALVRRYHTAQQQQGYNTIGERAKGNSTHQMKSLQWQQKVGCLKKRGMNLWFLISLMFFFLSAPFLALSLATEPASAPPPPPPLVSEPSVILLSAMMIEAPFRDGDPPPPASKWVDRSRESVGRNWKDDQAVSLLLLLRC